MIKSSVKKSGLCASDIVYSLCISAAVEVLIDTNLAISHFLDLL